MDQLIFASLSHTHYWYEVGTLKVPAVYSSVVQLVHGTACTRRLEDNRIYCSTRNLVFTLNIPLLPVYITLSTAVLSTSYVLSTYDVF